MPREPGGQVGERAVGDHGDRLAVDLHRPGQHGAQRLGRAQPAARRPAEPLQQGRVDGHPPAPQPDQRPLGLGQVGHLVGSSSSPPRATCQRNSSRACEPEPGVGQLLRRRGGDGPAAQAVAEQAGRPQHLDAGPGQGLGGRAQQLASASSSRSMTDGLACCSACSGGQTRAPRRRASNRSVSACAPILASTGSGGSTARRRRRPGWGRRCCAAAAPAGTPRARTRQDPGLPASPRPSSVGPPLRRPAVMDSLDPQPETRPGRQAVGGVGEPVGDITDRRRPGRGERRRRGGRGAAGERAIRSAIASHRSRISASGNGAASGASREPRGRARPAGRPRRAHASSPGRRDRAGPPARHPCRRRRPSEGGGHGQSVPRRPAAAAAQAWPLEPRPLTCVDREQRGSASASGMRSADTRRLRMP